MSCCGPIHTPILTYSTRCRIRRSTTSVFVRRSITRSTETGLLQAHQQYRERPAVGLYPPEGKYFGNPTQKYTYDPEKGEGAAEGSRLWPGQAGEGEDHDFPTRSGQMLPIAMNEFVQQNVKAVGIDSRFDVVEWGTMTVAMRNDPKAGLTAMVLTGSTSALSSVDPLTMFRYYAIDSFSPTNYNWGHFVSEEATALLKQAQASFDEAEQTKLLGQAHTGSSSIRRHGFSCATT